ncbi:isoaspartyl peptidase/L-asparaginase, partial [Candidatus Bathyarchaeota archaeon]|nr:isoaspartyl peptidase/L-asparaginase [Candidatus Bathyarchaeota archaeon]
MIRNPIVLAKTVLDKTMHPLTLGRVPPNLLVGKGATEFARENGLEIVPNENMVSKNAGHRFLRWQSDISRTRPSTAQPTRRQQAPSAPASGSSKQSDHKNALATGVWNEGQPDSPSFKPPHGEAARPAPTPPGPATTAQSGNTAYRAARNLMATIRGTGGRRAGGSDIDLRSEETDPLPSGTDTTSPVVSSGDRSSPPADGGAQSTPVDRESLD